MHERRVVVGHDEAASEADLLGTQFDLAEKVHIEAPVQAVPLRIEGNLASF